MLRVTKLYILVAIEITTEDKKQAKLTRLPAPPYETYYQTASGYIAYKPPVESRNSQAFDSTDIEWGKLSPSNHAQVAWVMLFWASGAPSNKLYSKVVRFLPRYILGLMSIDIELREAILGRLNGTGWYFHGDRIK